MHREPERRGSAILLGGCHTGSGCDLREPAQAVRTFAEVGQEVERLPAGQPPVLEAQEFLGRGIGRHDTAELVERHDAVARGPHGDFHPLRHHHQRRPWRLGSHWTRIIDLQRGGYVVIHREP